MDGISRRILRRHTATFHGNRSVEAVEDELRAHFAIQRHKFTFEGYIGPGASGLVFRVVEKLSGNTYRRLAIKRALRVQKEDDLRNEIARLTSLRGAEHIVRMVACRDEPEPPSLLTRVRRRLLRRRLVLQDSLAGLYGPVFMMEYMENGDVGTLYRKLRQHNELLPNRVLWSFFLCLIRACVALAYPLNGAEDQPNRLETIPTDGREPSMIEHADLHAGNVMIGEAGGGFPEHDLIPPLKFIDFGRTKEGTQGVSDNIGSISRMMINLIARQQVKTLAWVTPYEGFETKATEILHHGNGKKYPTLDDDIRDFLARCLAYEEQDRPSLSAMLQIAEDAVRNKMATEFPGHSGETDEAIRDLLRRFIYDASPEG
ncbi:kinase-like domain-containing protein [Whalleya microplaca]|nr:kinase-like domain-containing protein [Whalleya microplaca]